MDGDALQKMITKANAETDPALCNLAITLAHRRLSLLLREITGEEAGANFHSWAVWGSKKAGVTIRQEDLDGALHDATWVSGVVGLVVGLGAAAATTVALALAELASAAGVGLVVLGGLLGAVSGAWTGRLIARWSRRRAAALVLEGNRLVLDDIGRQTARFVAAFHGKEHIGDEELARFVDAMDARPAAEGGQELLQRAFRQYARAANARDVRVKHEACYYANCLAILNEHIKLQPYIEGSLPFIVRKCVTERMLTFEIGALELAVSQDVPALSGHAFPPTLATLEDSELTAFLTGPGGWDRSKDSLVGSRAGDWSKLTERMGYIVNLFRCFHADASVHEAPYGTEQVAAIERGVVPAGRL